MRAVLLSSLLLWCATAGARDVVAIFSLEGLENRPFILREYHSFSATRSVLMEGQVAADGEITLRWPDDGRLHFLELECGGAIWSLPVCGAVPEGAQLHVPAKGGAPFTARPGRISCADSMVKSGQLRRPWTPVIVAQMEALVDRYAARVAADIQQSLLWSGAAGGARASAEAALGSPIGAPGETASGDSLWNVLVRDFTQAMDSLLEGVEPGVVRDYVSVMRWSVLPELHPDSLETLRSVWRAQGVPSPDDAAGVALFRQGLDRFTGLERMSDEERAALGRAWMAGSMDSLVWVTSPWWGGPSEEWTSAWMLCRLGDGGLGYTPPKRFSRSRPIPPSVLDMLEAPSRQGLEVAVQRVRRHHDPPGSLPKALRVFAASGDLVDLESISGSGPVLWLWVDASAPSTWTWVQVLEQCAASVSGRGRKSGSGWPRDLTVVVVDAGGDWSAFQSLVGQAADRNGGLSRLPYRMIHTGGDLRWASAFEIKSLPAMRHNGPGGVPTPVEPPLPGPDLNGWLSKRS